MIFFVSCSKFDFKICSCLVDHILRDCFNGRECTAPKAEGGGREPCGLCKGEGKQQETCNDVSIMRVAVVIFFDVVVVVVVVIVVVVAVCARGRESSRRPATM